MCVYSYAQRYNILIKSHRLCPVKFYKKYVLLDFQNPEGMCTGWGQKLAGSARIKLFKKVCLQRGNCGREKRVPIHYWCVGEGLLWRLGISCGFSFVPINEALMRTCGPEELGVFYIPRNAGETVGTNIAWPRIPTHRQAHKSCETLPGVKML